MDETELLVLLKLGAKFQYREPTEQEKKDRILRMDFVLPGKIHEVEIEMKFTDE